MPFNYKKKSKNMIKLIEEYSKVNSSADTREYANTLYRELVKRGNGNVTVVCSKKALCNITSIQRQN